MVVPARGNFTSGPMDASSYGSQRNPMTFLRLLWPRRPIVRAIEVADNGTGGCDELNRERPL